MTDRSKRTWCPALQHAVGLVRRARQSAGVSYDKSAKRNVAGDDFRTALGAPNARRFLGELRLVDLGILSEADTMLGILPQTFIALVIASHPGLTSAQSRAIAIAID